MNSPCLVFPYHREPGFQYLPERVFTQTSLAVEVAGAVFVSRTIGAGGTFTDVFLVGFDPVGGYLGLGGLEIQFTGAYELMELSARAASLTYEFQGAVLVD